MRHAISRLCTNLLILLAGQVVVLSGASLHRPAISSLDAPLWRPALAWAEEGLAEQRARERLEALLLSPLTSDRTLAGREAVRNPESALRWARTWVTSPDAGLRRAGWSVLARIGEPSDLVAARASMNDLQPAVSALAAEALVDMASRLQVEEEPWLPAKSVGPESLKPLASALVRRLEESVDKSLPTCLFRLGEGTVPALSLIARDTGASAGVRDAAIEALSRIGGDAARAGLGRLASNEEMVKRSAWWRALIEVGNGPGLRPVHELVETWAFEAVRRSSRWRTGSVQGPPQLHWRTRALFYRFIAACPPPDTGGHVAEFLRERLLSCERRTGRDKPTVVVAVLRSYLVMCDPEDDAISNAVSAAGVRARRSTRWREELGEVLASLEVYRERDGLQRAVRELLAGRDLPRTVKAWGHYLSHDTSAEDVRPMALELLQLDGDAATLAQRRLGVRLLDRVGGAPASVLRRIVQDPDSWLRVWSLARLLRLPSGQEGACTPEERGALLARALADQADRVFLLAVSSLGPAAGGTARERMLQIYVRGARGVRPAAARALVHWAELADAWASPAAAAEPVPTQAPAQGSAWAPARPGAALDERVRAAASFRARMGD